MFTESGHFKDEILKALSRQGNIAQYLSFSPQLELRHFNIFKANPVSNIEENIAIAIERSSEKRVNVRSFHPDQPKGHPFSYGLETVHEVLTVLRKRSEAGLYTIVNETIDTNDGGVSGVCLGDVIEFTPNDTPKGVDKPGVCSLSKELGTAILKTVYGFEPFLPFNPNFRVEFSIHPIRRGIRNEQTILWELEEFDSQHTLSRASWPNNFSRHIGDKVFGLLVAYHAGFNVPKTIAITRTVAPFSFGNDTGLSESWIRTAPFDRTPGKYSTFFGWHDPFKLLADEDPTNENIASVLSQQSVDAVYSGSLITDENGEPIVEGVSGRGDEFMVGRKDIVAIPSNVKQDVVVMFEEAVEKFGPVEMEWVHDGKKVWIVQLHILKEKIPSGNIIYPGNPTYYEDFKVDEGLESLRKRIDEIKGKNIGITLHGNVGITSHFGDVLRKSRVPSIIVR